MGNANLVIYYSGNDQNNFRFAISIGKKYGSAVERNLCKRRIRMIISTNQSKINQRSDFVIVVKPKTNSLTFNQINEQIITLLLKAKIIEKIEDL